MKKNVVKILTFVCAASVVLTACGSDSEASKTSDEATNVSDDAAASSGNTSASAAVDSTPSESSEPSTSDDSSTSDTKDTESKALVSFASTADFGEIAVNGDGMTLYGFIPDVTAGKVTCDGDCAVTWPPVTVPSSDLPEGLSADVFSVTEGPNGFQLQIADVPLYLYEGDSAPGETKGQGAGNNWYVVGPDGSLNS